MHVVYSCITYCGLSLLTKASSWTPVNASLKKRLAKNFTLKARLAPRGGQLYFGGKFIQHDLIKLDKAQNFYPSFMVF